MGSSSFGNTDAFIAPNWRPSWLIIEPGPKLTDWLTIGVVLDGVGSRLFGGGKEAGRTTGNCDGEGEGGAGKGVGGADCCDDIGIDGGGGGIDEYFVDEESAAGTVII